MPFASTSRDGTIVRTIKHDRSNTIYKGRGTDVLDMREREQDSRHLYHLHVALSQY
jgi:hypothetical protein